MTGVPTTAPLRGLSDALTDRSDQALAELLTRRPDLASPPPRGTARLTQRALSAASIALAGDSVDLPTVAVIEAFLDCGGPISRHDLIGPVTREDLIGALGRRIKRAELDASLADLVAQGLIWDSGTGTARKPAWVAGIHLAAALPWRGHHLIGPLAAATPAEIRELIDAL
ncbi:MAG: hypothetical protein WAW85_17215, partial [Gordonia sp. (in: high G+C Gram-positive bacteria)]